MPRVLTALEAIDIRKTVVCVTDFVHPIPIIVAHEIRYLN